MVENNRITPTDVIDRIMSSEGLYEKIFGKLLPELVNDRGIAYDIHTLKRVF